MEVRIFIWRFRDGCVIGVMDWTFWTVVRWFVISYMLVFATRGGGDTYSLFWDHVKVTLLLKNASDILDQASKDLFAVETRPLSDLGRRQ
jgi:hypothetical protein